MLAYGYKKDKNNNRKRRNLSQSSIYVLSGMESAVRVNAHLEEWKCGDCEEYKFCKAVEGSHWGRTHSF